MKVLKVRWWGTGSLELDESLEGEVVGGQEVWNLMKVLKGRWWGDRKSGT